MDLWRATDSRDVGKGSECGLTFTPDDVGGQGSSQEVQEGMV